MQELQTANLLNQSNIMFAIGLIGIVITVYKSLTNPQRALDKKQALDQATMSEKATALAREANWNKEATEKRFVEIQAEFKDFAKMTQGNIMKIEVKVDVLQKSMEQMGKDLVKISTIISERSLKL